MLQARLKSGPGSKKHGQPKHHWHNHKRHVPENHCQARTPVNAAILALFQPSPGIEAGSVAMLRNRASWGSIRHWRRGHRQTPQWVLAAILEALDAKAAAIEHARQLILDEQKKRAGS